MNSSNAQQLLDNIRTAVISLDQSLNIDFANAAAQSLFNTSLTRTQGKTLSSIFLDAEDLNDLISQAHEREASIIHRQVNLHLHDTKSITLDISVTALKDCTLLEFHSLDRLMRINREKNIFSSQNSSKELIRNLAHEIKNPLAGLSGAAQLLQREISQTSYAEYTKIIIAEAQRLTNLVDTLLGPNKKQIQSPTNIHEILEDVFQLIQVEISNQDIAEIKISKHYDPSIPEINANKEQLIQVFLNISKNAVQVLLDHKIDGEITARTSVERNHTIGNVRHKLVCRVDIEDNGPGIAQEHQESIFLPLVSHSKQGTGLGLAIAQSMISQHNGLITLQSKPGSTCFSLYLPLS